MRLLNRFFASASSPIGVDLGSSTLKLAQVAVSGGEDLKLIAAAGAQVPQDQRGTIAGRMKFFAESAAQLLSQSGFRGRRVVLGLPASCTHLERLRIPPLDDDGTRQAVSYEVSDKLPFHVSRAVIRHLIAGEVYEENEKRNEVIVMASRRELTERFFAAAAAARLEVTGVHAEPVAIMNCFAACSPPAVAADHIGARAFVDIGSSGTRMYIVRGRKLQFARGIGIGSNDLEQAIVQRLNIRPHEAPGLLRKLAAASIGAETHGEPSAATAVAVADPGAEARQAMLRVEQACYGPLRNLVEELALSLRYHASAFPSTPVERLIFLGGAAGQGRLCEKIAYELGLEIEPIDPLASAVPGGETTASSAAWAVAVGLSLSGTS